MSEPEVYLSIFATALATASFGAEAWRLWRDRPRLQFFVTPITFQGVPHFGEMTMVRIMICNIGYRPIVLTRFAAIGATSSFRMGIGDEPAAALGQLDQRFPALLEPGKTLNIHPITVDALRRNQEPPPTQQHYHDPYQYFVVIDSFGQLHPMKIEDVMWHLHLSSQHSRLRGWRKLKTGFAERRFLRSARKRLLQDQ